MTQNRLLGVAFVILLIAIAGNGYLNLQNKSDINNEIHRITTEGRFIRESCARLNIVRVEANISQFADYRVFKIVLDESLRTPEPPNQTRQQRILRAEFLNQLNQAIHDKTWVPRTDCKKAVAEHGPAFRAPAPLPFTRALPPAPALTLYSSDFNPSATQ